MKRILPALFLLLLLSFSFAQVAQLIQDKTAPTQPGFNFSSSPILKAQADSGAALAKTIYTDSEMAISLNGQTLIDTRIVNQMAAQKYFAPRNMTLPVFTDCMSPFSCSVYLDQNFYLPYTTNGPSDFSYNVVGGNLALSSIQYQTSQIVNASYVNWSYQTEHYHMDANLTTGAPAVDYDYQINVPTTIYYQTSVPIWADVQAGQTYSGLTHFRLTFNRLVQPGEDVDIQVGFLGQVNDAAGIFSSAVAWFNCPVQSTTSENLVNFPFGCSVNTTSALFNSNGTNIYFTQDNFSKLNSELDSNSSTYFGTASTKNSTYWIGANSTGTTVLNITGWIMPTAATDGMDAMSLWNNASYFAVYHFSANNLLFDSARNNNLSKSGIVNSIVNASLCKFGECAQFNNNTFLFNSSAVGIPTNINASAVSAWGYRFGLITTSGYATIAATSQTSSLNRWMGYGDYAGAPDANNSFSLENSGATTTHAVYLPAQGNLNYYAANYSNISTEISNLTRNSSTIAQLNTGATPARICIADATCVAGSDSWSNFRTGATVNSTLDEIRFSNVSRTTGWFQAEYASPANATGLTLLVNTTTMATAGTGVNPIFQNTAFTFNASASTSLGTFQGFNCSTFNNTVNVSSINYACNGGFCSNLTTYGVLNQSPSIYGIGDQVILSCMAYSTNNFVNSTYLNSFIYTVEDDPPVLTNLMITPNSTTSTIYQSATLNGNATAQTNNTAQVVNGSFSWYKNGVNQTGLAGWMLLYNNTPNWTALTPAGGFNASDNWSFGIQLNDTFNWTASLNTSNTTITGFITNLTMNSTTQEYDLFSYSHGLNFTAAAGVVVNSVSAGYGGSTFAATLTASSGGAQQWNASIQPPFSSTTNNYTITWTINTSAATQTNTTAYNITVNASGLYPCNSSINTLSLNYSMVDANSSASINATLTSLFNITSSNGSIKTIPFTFTNNSIGVCMGPAGSSFNATLSDTENASGYQPTFVSRSLVINATVYNLTLYLQPLSLAVPTQITVYQYPTNPLNAVSISIFQFTAPTNYTLIQSCTTMSAGTCLVYLTPNTLYYQFNLSYLGANYSFGPQTVVCTPGSTICYQNLVINSPSLPYYTSGNFTGLCVFSNSSLILNCTGSDLGTIIKTFNLTGSTITGPDCSNSSVGSSATLTCSYPNTSGTYTFAFQGYDANGNPYLLSAGSFQIQPGPATYGASGWLAVLILFCIIAMAGAVSPGLSIALGIFALLLGGLMGFVPMGSMQQALIVIGAMGGILIWRLKV